MQAYPLIVFMTFFLVAVTFFLTSCTDPGILPRSSVQAMMPGVKREIEEYICYEVPDESANAGTTSHARNQALNGGTLPALS